MFNSMDNKPLVSLCIPTNGVIEWVFPVLQSIYNQDVDNTLFEVIITDNGDNKEFKNKLKKYIESHPNILYAETKALPFINEIESYKLANGELIKFVNHRTRLIDGSLEKIIDYARKNMSQKPITYFTNGVLKKDKAIYRYESFDLFVRNLSYWSSWSTGMTIWKSDFEKLPKDAESYNELFPHTDILFAERNRDQYIIDNSIIFDEIPQGNRPKGKYDVYGAFGIEYMWILCTLLRDKSISFETYKCVANDNLGFISQLYWRYNIRKQYCSYDLNGLKEIFGVFYTKGQFVRKIISWCYRRILKKLSNKMRYTK